MHIISIAQLVIITFILFPKTTLRTPYLYLPIIASLSQHHNTRVILPNLIYSLFRLPADKEGFDFCSQSTGSLLRMPDLHHHQFGCHFSRCPLLINPPMSVFLCPAASLDPCLSRSLVLRLSFVKILTRNMCCLEVV